MTQNSTILPASSGTAGEHFVAAELSRRGYIACMTPSNTKGIDIIASNRNGTRCVGVQVKTNRDNSKTWRFTEKIETDTDPSTIFIFVLLNELSAPQYYVVPHAVVKKQSIESHKKWLAEPGRNGQSRKENPTRSFTIDSEEYRDKWELLKLS